MLPLAQQVTLLCLRCPCHVSSDKENCFFFFFHTDGNEGSPQSSLCSARTLKWDYRGLGQTEGHHSLTKLVPPLRLPPLKLIQPASQLNLRKKIPSGCQTQTLRYQPEMSQETQRQPETMSHRFHSGNIDLYLNYRWIYIKSAQIYFQKT